MITSAQKRSCFSIENVENLQDVINGKESPTVKKILMGLRKLYLTHIMSTYRNRIMYIT